MPEAVFLRLESSLIEVVQFLRRLQNENENLQQEIRKLKKEVEELTKHNQAESQVIEGFENDRLRIRARVERLLASISTLGEPMRESSVLG